MTTSGEADAAWRSFFLNPAAYVHPQRLAECFDGGVPQDICNRLKNSKRLQKRLSDLISSHYRLPSDLADESHADGDMAIVLNRAEWFDDIILRAGVIFWGKTIANIVLARDVVALQEHLGLPLCNLAIEHRSLSGPEQSLHPLENLKDRISEDGRRCLLAWYEQLPPVLAQRFRLKFPAREEPSESVAEPFVSLGPPIVRCAAQNESG